MALNKWNSEFTFTITTLLQSITRYAWNNDIITNKPVNVNIILIGINPFVTQTTYWIVYYTE